MKQSLKLDNGTRTAARHALQWCCLSFFVAMVGAGCGQKAPVAAEIDPVGTYALVSVNGNKLPYAIAHEGATPTIKSGTFDINADGTCRSVIVFSVPPRGDDSREVKATYTRAGTNLTMQWQGAGVTVGSIGSGTFTMENEGMTFAYRK